MNHPDCEISGVETSMSRHRSIHQSADMNPPTDPDKEEKSPLGGWLAAVMVCFLLYVLSIGPAAALAMKSGSTGAKRTLKTFYMPVIMLHEIKIFEKPLEKYLELWGVK